MRSKVLVLLLASFHSVLPIMTEAAKADIWGDLADAIGGAGSGGGASCSVIRTNPAFWAHQSAVQSAANRCILRSKDHCFSRADLVGKAVFGTSGSSLGGDIARCHCLATSFRDNCDPAATANNGNGQQTLPNNAPATRKPWKIIACNSSSSYVRLAVKFSLIEPDGAFVTGIRKGWFYMAPNSGCVDMAEGLTSNEPLRYDVRVERLVNGSYQPHVPSSWNEAPQAGGGICVPNANSFFAGLADCLNGPHSERSFRAQYGSWNDCPESKPYCRAIYLVPN